VKTDVQQVEDFLRYLFNAHPPHTKTSEVPRVVLTRKVNMPDRIAPFWTSASFKKCEFHNAARYADTAQDVYLRQTTIGFDLIRSGTRSTADQALTGGHLWADVDFQDPSHKADKLPADANAALAIVDAVLPPSAVIHSGGGIYPIWRLTDYVDLTTAERRARFQGVNVSITEALKRFGIHVDNVSSPDRILRPVGTVNRKRPDDLRRVTWLRHPDDGAGDFTYAQIEEKFPPVIRVQPAQDVFLKRERNPIARRFNDDPRNTWEWILAQDERHEWHLNAGHGVKSWRRRQNVNDGNPETLRIDKDDPSCVIVCSAVIADEWGVLPGRRLDKFGLACRILDLDPSQFLRGLS